ncbi:nuclear valosin-containing protein-like [Phlebotomus papatasi]|uniref:nuclear valosin-containing protein-like n=1 Tax=Phlebotomus papatasi TaxID=29031 RepID=UPI002483F9A4|nr:nuclear valosin-containing protein-like [Phlebotomus papatasi]
MIKKDKPLLYDAQIISRVKQYLEDNVHQTYVDVAVMAQDLQDKYKEYNKRKAGPFRLLVEQAYKTVLHSYGLDSNPSSDEDGDVNSDLEFMDENQSKQQDTMNDALQSLYMNNKGNKRAPATAVSQGDLINISSDESGDESSVAKKHPILAKVTPDIIVTKIQKPTEAPKAPAVSKAADIEPSQPLAKKRKVDHPTDARVESNAKSDPKTVYRQEPKEPALPEAPDSVSQALKMRKSKKDPAVKSSGVTFEHFGGNEKILKEICEVLLYFKRPKVCRYIGMTPPRGLLIHGPPGSGKTLLAHAIAGQLKIPIMEVAAPEFVTGISGDSEARIRRIFDQVASLAPCVLFIDEIDVISAHRNNAQKDMERRIVAQLIISMDGLSKMPNGDQVLVIGATSRVDVLDPALRRGGRFDMEISLGIPDREARADILRIICDKMTLERPFDFDALAALTPGFVGVDLVTLSIMAARVAFMKVIIAKEGKAFLQKYSKMHEKNANLVPVVNLTDDNLMDHFMDVDDVTSSTKEDKVEDTPEIVIDDEDGPEKVKEPAPQEATIKENGNVENNVESTEGVEEKKDEPMDTATEKPPGEVEEEAKKPEEAIIEKVPEEEEVPVVVEEKEPEKKPEEKVPEEKVPEEKAPEVEVPEEKVPEEVENGDVTVIANTEPAIDITESPAKVEPEPAKVDTCNEEKTETNSTETLAEALLKDPKFRLQLSLTEMINLLSKETSITLADLKDFCITMEDFQEALKTTQPVAKREGFITVPNVTWQDIGSLWDIREELKLAVTSSVKYPKKLKALKLEPSCGVLLCGPPGCGKTLLAKAVANEAGINFISVKGPELLNMYVGESERAVRQCFQRARYSAPCVIFFDEFDALCPKRSSRTENTGAARVVNQLLTEMDGLEDRKGVFVLAATNRPDMIDSAVLRPGRFDKILFVGIPGTSDREDILRALTKNGTEPRLADDVSLDILAIRTDGYTGADLAGLVRQASVKAFKESLTTDSDDSDDIKVTMMNFMEALKETKPSVSAEEKANYENLRIQYSSQSG